MGAPIGREEKIKLLVVEYESLRTDILQLEQIKARLLPVGATALVGVPATLEFKYIYTSIVLALIFLSILALLLNLIFDSTEVDCRLREIEAHINRLSGETLLQWHITRTSTATDRRRVEYFLRKSGAKLLWKISVGVVNLVRRALTACVWWRR